MWSPTISASSATSCGCLADHGCRVTVVPAQTPAEKVLAMNPDGIFLSNGPGDPEPCTYAIEAIKKFLETDIPVFGICLGHQLLGLASDAKTVKMKFGHHGANHPVLDTAVRPRADLQPEPRLRGRREHARPQCEGRRTSRCSMVRCRASSAPIVPPSASRAIPKRAPARRTWASCSTKFTAMIHERLATQHDCTRQPPRLAQTAGAPPKVDPNCDSCPNVPTSKAS